MALEKELLFKCRLNDLGTTIVCGGTDTFTNKSARKLMYQIMVAAANGLARQSMVMILKMHYSYVTNPRLICFVVL